MNLCNIVKKYGAVGEWAMAAEKFADYWTGAGTWQEMSADRRLAFSEALKPNFFEWDAVMGDTTPVEEWAAVLPRATLLAFDPVGVSPTREIVAILRRFCPGWTASWRNRRNPTSFRGLGGGAEGIRTSDLRSQAAPSLSP